MRRGPARDSRSCASRSRTTPRSRWSARALASLTAPARWRAATWTPSSMRRGARACPRTSLPRSASTPAPRFSSSRRTARRGCSRRHSTRRHHDSGGGPGRHGKIVTVFSPKGGTGKTVIATNLAAACAKYEGRKTLLLDLDLQFGDAAIMLGVDPEKTIYDLVVAPGELDSEKLAGYTTKHACGLEVLPAPLRPEDAELVTEAKLGRLLEVARESFDVIVVDTSPFFHGPMLATLDRTDELLLLAGLDVPTLKNVRLSLQTLELLSFPPDRIKLVLNRANSKVGMKPKEVESALEREIGFEIPSDRIVPLAVNRGNPAVLAEPKAALSKAIRAMAKDLVASQAVAKQKKKFMATLARA